MIKENLEHVEERIQKACEKVGRDRQEVTLIAVSKTKPIEMIKEVTDEGIYDFGENKVQEICNKYDMIDKNVRWHLIGHLQRNKVKQVIEKVTLIHSVDSLRLAKQIEEEAAKINRVVDILIQVNIAQEATKFGMNEEEIYGLINEIKSFSHVKIKGLMTIAPFTENPEENRVYFRKMHKLLIDIKTKNIDNIDMDILSMGMTGDYEVAIEEGATMIRVGTGIFGERNYNV